MGVTISTKEIDSNLSYDEALKLLPKGDTEWVNYKGEKVMMIRSSSCTKPKQ